jgi:hypothetical protein
MKHFLFFCFLFTLLGSNAQEELTYPQVIFDGNYLIVKNENDQFGVTDKKGNTVVPFVYNRIIEHSIGLIVYKKNKTTGYERSYSSGYFNKAFKQVLPCNYSSITAVDDGTLVACQNKDKKFGLVDSLGRILVPFKYDEMNVPSEKLICVKYETKYGYIDQKDKVIIPFKFQFAKPFSEGLAVATTNQLMGFIDKRGHFEIKERFTGANDFHYGFAEVFINDEASCIDTKGSILFPFLFKSISSIGNDLFLFEAPSSYRGKLATLLKETPKSDQLDQVLPEINPNQETNDFDDLYTDEGAFEFQGILDLHVQIIGGEGFRIVNLLSSDKTNTLFAVQSIDEIQQKENWNYALMNQTGKLLTNYRYLELQFDDVKQQIIGTEEKDDQFQRFSLDVSGKATLLK